MTPFAYRAVDPRGRIVRGRLDAGNLADLELRLSRLDLELLHGKAAPPLRLPSWKRQLPRRELINFCFHLEQFLQAGVPIIESLADLRDSIETPHFREIVASLVGAIVAELPTGAQAGLGARLLTGSYYGQTVQIWAALFAAAIVASVLVALTGLAERLTLRGMGLRR